MKTITIAALAGLTISGITTQSHALTFTLDVSGMASWDFQGDPDNEILELFIGANAPISYISWNLNITTVGASWADELTIGIFGNSTIINPASGDAFSVTNMNYQGTIDAAHIILGADGILDFEFYEIGFDDNANAIDAFFEAGSTITVTIIPTPSSLAMLGLAGLFTTRRRR